MSNDVNTFLQSQGSKAFPFENVGDTVSGTITEMSMRQQTGIENGEPQFWPDGRPKQMVVLVLQTELSDDENDDGLRSVYLRGGNYSVASGKGASSLTALREALKQANAREVVEGGTLTMGYTGIGSKTKGGFSAPKLYTIKYVPPQAAIGIDELM